MEHLSHTGAAATDPVRRSWQRCQARQLPPEQPLPTAATSRSLLAERLLANAPLVAYAQPLIEHLHQQLARSSSLVLLADPQGMILRLVGDSDFVARASRIALHPGACWDEARMGTNAIGTAIIEQQTVAVSGDQHYLERNRFLTSIATPIHAPQLAAGPGPRHPLLGLLNIASDARVSHTHVRALLQGTAEIIENRLLDALTEADVALQFHCTAEALGTPLAGLALFAADGSLRGWNRRARQLLGDESEPTHYRELFHTPWDELLDRAAVQPLPGSHGSPGPRLVLSRSGRPLYLRLLYGPAPAAAALPSPAASLVPQDAPPPGSANCALQELDLGDPRMAEAVHRARRIVSHDIPLLIQGETGTGKELFAHAYHRSGPRRAGPFVAVNCAAIPAALVESELFGYVDGAYTGARKEGATGRIQQAHGGTLFLDEIGDMPLALQAILLRVLETRQVAPLGGGEEERVDLALICASHRPLRELVSDGSFRADLFFRLSGMTVTLPPLRERSDFKALVRRLLAEESPQRSIRLSPEALGILQRQPWPGNLRQLRNVLRLATALLDEQDEGILTPLHLPPELLEAAPLATPTLNGPSLRANESRLVQEAVARHHGNISAAARELGITRTTLYRKLRQG